MNGHTTNIDTTEATEHLKNILNVGKGEMESGKTKLVSNGSTEPGGDRIIDLSAGSYQKIDLHANKDSSHVSVYGTNVDVFSSAHDSGATCNQVIVENVVDYHWDEKYYFGKLLSIHLNGLYSAYVLKPSTTKHGYVRVLHKRLNVRHLIKDYTCEVRDVAFAHSTSRVLLGSVDARGELFVHEIGDDASAITCSLLLHIERPSDWESSDHCRVIWCLYIPDDNEEDSGQDVSTLLVVTHNQRAEILNVDSIVQDHGHGNLNIDEIKNEVQTITEHMMPITAATFSPDGTALAIGSLDGVVRFYQVNLGETKTSPRCLHQWTPHPEKSLSSLYFLDNHKNHRPDDQFWKIAITGADNNTELKIWSCETWTCLQTIKIHPNPDDTIIPCLKSEMDLSSKYLFLSDINRKVLLILLVQQEAMSGNAMICSLSEYRLLHPVLSLDIWSIKHSKAETLAECKTCEEEDEEEIDEEPSHDAEETCSNLIIQLQWIHTKSLQSCRILYKPKIISSMHSVDSLGTLSQDSCGFKDALSDISVDSREASLKDIQKSFEHQVIRALTTVDPPSLPLSLPSSSGLTSHLNESFQKCSEILLTPNDFTSPSHPTVERAVDALSIEPLARRKSSQHSGTSSPSREVAEILAAPAKPLDDIITNNAIVKDNLEALTNNLGSFRIADSSDTDTSSSKPDYLVKDWPQAPDPTKEYRVPPTKNINFEGSYEDLLLKLESIAEVVREQKFQMQSLQNEVKAIRQEQRVAASRDALDASFVENAVSQSLAPHYLKVENLITKQSSEDRKATERSLSAISEELSTNFGNKMQKTVKSEVSTVLPQINRSLDNIVQKIQADFSEKLSSTDTGLKDSFTKYLKSKAFTDTLSTTVSSSLQNVVHSACKDIFQNSVVPSFEKACQQLFHQLNDMFSKGIADYFIVLEKQGQKNSESMEAAAAFMKEQVNNLVSGAQLAIQAQNIKSENNSMETLKRDILGEVRVAVGEEVRRAVSHVSRAATPAPVVPDVHVQRQQLSQLLQQGRLDDAFQQALTAMDVQLVLFVCENVSPDQVFGVTPCPLKQHVLLSLLNQLSADLSIKTDIKVRYIEDVIACLDNTNPIIREHIHGVLDSLQQRISNFLLKSPSHKLARNLRRISLAVNALIKC